MLSTNLTDTIFKPHMLDSIFLLYKTRVSTCISCTMYILFDPTRICTLYLLFNMVFTVHLQHITLDLLLMAWNFKDILRFVFSELYM